MVFRQVAVRKSILAHPMHQAKPGSVVKEVFVNDLFQWRSNLSVKVKPSKDLSHRETNRNVIQL